MVPSGAKRVRRRRVPSSAMLPVSITHGLERLTPDTGPMAAAPTLRIDPMSDLRVEGWPDAAGRGPRTAFRPPGAAADIAGDAANGVERCAVVILEAAAHRPEGMDPSADGARYAGAHTLEPASAYRG